MSVPGPYPEKILLRFPKGSKTRIELILELYLGSLVVQCARKILICGSRQRFEDMV